MLTYAGMLELHELGTLLNQKHPEMKKKVGRLRAFLDKHKAHLRVVTSHDVNGTPSDLVLLKDSPGFLKKIRTLHASERKGDRGRRHASTRGGGYTGGSKGLLSKLRARARADACDVEWDDLSSGAAASSSSPLDADALHTAPKMGVDRSSIRYICVRILLLYVCIRSYCLLCVGILLCMCAHTARYASAHCVVSVLLILCRQPASEYWM